MADRFLRAVVGFAIGVAVARHLGPAQYGELSYVLALMALFQVAAALGVDNLVIRDVAKHPDQARPILATAFRLRMTAGFLGWMATLVAIAWSNSLDIAMLGATAIAASAVAFQAFDIIDLWFQTRSESRRTVAAKLVALLAGATMKLALIVVDAPLSAFLGIVGLEALLAAVGLAVAYRTAPATGSTSPPQRYARRLLKEAWPYLAAGLMVMVYMRLDQVILKTLVGEAELGRYAAALQLSQAWHAVAMALSISVAPFLYRHRQHGTVAYEAALLAVFRLFGGLGLGFAAVTAAFARPLVRLLYGAEFEQAASIVAIHAFSNVFVFLGVAQSLWIVAESKGSIGLIRTAAGAAVGIGLNLLLVPTLGAIGTATAAVAAQAVAAVVCNVFLAPRILVMQFGFSPRPVRS